MKVFRRILVWVTLSLALQFGGLIYANNYLFSTQTKVKIEKVEKTSKNVKDAVVNVPSNEKNAQVSFDAKYLAYYDNDSLKIVNTKTGKVNTVDFNDGVKVSYFKWLPDRNRMLIGEKHTGSNGNSFKLSYYDVDKDIKEQVKDLTWADKKAEVVDIQASPLTNVIYVKVALGGKRSSIYWINIMKEMKKVETNAYVIGKIDSLSHKDKLLYEDLTHKRVYVTGNRQQISIPGVQDTCLIGVDDEDKVYIGELENNQVTKVYYGDLSEDTSTWKSEKLPEASNQSDIYISPNGKIHVNDNLRGVITELGSGKETNYNGNFLQMYTDGVTSISEGKLEKQLFN
ncbi:MAG: hypothetical protein K0R54_3107 [Clostridiaceae bacterium]|jgi:hypothetical protein|nr:hypothetical protein [Clostridiaceae bacterium]